jgi:hypothetical protein
VAGDRGGQRHRRAGQRGGDGEEFAPVDARAGAIRLQQRGHVHAGGEHAGHAGQHDAAGAAGNRTGQRSAQRVQQFQVQCVDRRARQPDLGDGVVSDDFKHGVAPAGW